MNVLTVVMAHGGAQEIFDRHLPLWEAHGWPIEVVCPEDDRVKTNHRMSAFGKSEHHGREQRFRILEAMKWVLQLGYDCSVWFDYDSFCIHPNAVKIRHIYDIQANVGENLEPWRFLAHWYPGAPMVLTHSTLCQLVFAALQSPLVFEEGFADRLIGAWAQIGGIGVGTFDPPGFWKTDINEAEWPNLDRALAAGAIWIHGVKSEATFNHIMEFKNRK